MNKRFRNIILTCQRLKKKHGFDYEVKCMIEIDVFSMEIIEQGLIEKCKDKHFAKQLCIMNGLTYE